MIAGYGVYGIVCFFKRDTELRLKLAKGLATGLEFKLGSEILRTVLVRDLSEIAIVGAIILLRAALSFLIHWEIKNERRMSRSQKICTNYISLQPWRKRYRKMESLYI